MFEYFPGGPYTYNLAVVATLNSGGLIDEVDRACRPIRDAAANGEDAGKARHIRTAGQLYFRTANYLAQAERKLAHSDPDRVPTYRRPLQLTQKAFDLHSPRVGRVAIPYEGTTLPAYLSLAPAADDGPAPVVVLVNGLDSTKEHLYTSNHWAELAARGISCLMLDQPGTGEALRLQGLTARIDAEAWGSAVVDWLQQRDELDASRIGIVGWSLGGYYAPRVAADENSPTTSTSTAWSTRSPCRSSSPTAPTTARSLWHMHTAPTTRPSTPKRQLRVFTPEEGATEHVGLDHLPHVSTFIADWVADTFAELRNVTP